MTAVNRTDLEARDADDPLAPLRERFELPEGIIYLDGNSLGAMPVDAAMRVRDVVRKEWAADLIKSWNVHDWFNLPRRCGDKIATIVGASPGEVVAADSTSVNLFKLLAAALTLRPGRRIILSETDNFPTDLYIAQGLNRLLGGEHELRLIEDGANVIDAIAEAGDDLACAMITHVNYRTGWMHDMAATTAAAHDAGALMLWDLAHSAGAVPVDLNGANADLAVGCGYKYLNGGPGAPAFLYVANRLQDDIRPPLSGWMGHEAPFLFDTDYRPAEGITRNLCGTPSVIAMSALDAALDVFMDADMTALRAKSLALTDLFIDLMAQECGGPDGDWGFTCETPAADRRGSQVSFAHADGYPIMQALIDRGVIGDFRAPDLLRFGFTPLYTRYTDVWDGVAALKDIMQTGAWDAAQFHEKAAVT